MNTYQLLGHINNKIRSKVGYASVLSYDKFMKLNLNQLKLPAAIIVNTKPAYERGQHWFSVFITESKLAYLNSLKCSPKICNSLFRKLNQSGKKIEYLNNRIQSEYSNTCGMYCLVFLMSMIIHGDFMKFSSLFRYNNFKYNENVIKSLYYKYFH